MMKTLVKMKFGSHLFGTNTDTSDTDLKAVHLEDMDRMFLNRVRKVVNHEPRTKTHGEKNTASDTDFESFELNKYAELLCEGQTVALDMLFAPPDYWIEHSPEWEMFTNNKHLFLTKRASSFVGYCRTQANKYGIKGSRVAAARASVEFLGSLYNHNDSTTRLKDKELDITQWVIDLKNEHVKIIPKDDTYKEPMLEVCNRKCQWGNSLKNARDIFKRVLDEYGTRAMQAESNLGVDWKALSHAVRIGEEAIELLNTGNITLPRPNASYLLNIKQGKIAYATVASRIEELLEEVEISATKSSLPNDIDREKVDDLILGMYKKHLLEQSLGKSAIEKLSR